ncbi:MAG: hypothetical protein FWE67_06955 [Planctomycetaceae bacterium]|nr:hypothetical protein [Planctomycetaceae bacterium]
MKTKKIFKTSFFLLLTAVFFTAAVSIVSAQDEAAPKKTKRESEKKGQSLELYGEKFQTEEPSPVRLSAMYYYGDGDKETTPVLLLHDIKGRGSEFASLTRMLNDAGYAVLQPDLRGHGNSTSRNELQTMPASQKQPIATPQWKLNREYKEETFQNEDYALICTADLPLLRKTLIGRHDIGYVNMNRLVIVGVGRSATLAAILASYDWQNKDSDKFTKTLVLIAPAPFMQGAETMASLMAANAGNMQHPGNPQAMQQQMQRNQMMRNAAISPAMTALLSDFTKGFRGNRFILENLAVMTAIPQNDAESKELADKLRNVILDKDKKKTEKEKEAEKNKEETMFPIIVYPIQKKVKSDDGKETSQDMRFSEIMSAHLAKEIFSFVEKRNEEFNKQNNKYRWTKRK